MVKNKTGKIRLVGVTLYYVSPQNIGHSIKHQLKKNVKLISKRS